MSDAPRNPFHQWIRLEQPRLGSRVVFATDDFFAAKERLIDPAEPVFVPDKYDEHGKWMDGWESRRKRDPGNDCCVVRLGTPGIVRGVDIDTRFFTGNYPPAASLEGCESNEDLPTSGWRTLLPKTEIGADAHHFLAVDDGRPVTHLRLNIFPDGGVARLRVYGEVCADFGAIDRSDVVDLFAFAHGGRALACSDEHFGSMHNLNAPGRGVNMGDGWETARRRGPGNDWVVVALGAPGRIERVNIDTAHFKGNYPERVSLRAAHIDDETDLVEQSASWPLLLPESALSADSEHRFDGTLEDPGPVSHVRLDIFPDGGVSRLRLYGRIADEEAS